MRPLVLVLMGVSGSGKTTIGKALAARLGWPFKEGDDLHPAANIAKMKSGHPLDDADRAPWLEAIAGWISAELESGSSGVIACSALKRGYRQRLAADHPDQVRFVYLMGSRALIGERVAARRGHFMPPSLLGSQFADLQAPSPEEHAITVDVSQPIQDQVEAIVGALAVADPRLPPA